MFADISGFTPLTEQLAALGAEGVEKLSAELNKYFDSLVSIISKHGGDIIKFAGDAVLVIWPATSAQGLPGMIILASICAKELLTSLNEYTVPTPAGKAILRLHIGLGAGPAGGVTVGGVNDQVEFFISGQVLEQVSSCEKQALPGEVYVSASAWSQVEPGILAGKIQGKEELNYRLDSVKVTVDLPPLVQLPLYTDMIEPLKKYLQPAVLRYIADPSGKKWMAELRSPSVVFVMLTQPLSPFVEALLPQLQDVIADMQTIIYRYEGTVRQFLIDDKGSVMIAGFGLPPRSHEDDAARAVLTALEISSSLLKQGVSCSIGVTTGTVFCGNVGSEQRREYAMVGDIVNLSARLMVASKGGVLVDSPTYNSAKGSPELDFEKQDPIRVKGKTNPIDVFIPYKRKTAKAAVANSNAILVGRKEEISTLEERLKRLQTKMEIEDAGHPLILILEGEAGVGKTRLVNHMKMLYSQLEHFNKQHIYTGSGENIQRGDYYIWRTICAGALDATGKYIKKELLLKIFPDGDRSMLPLLKAVLPLNISEKDLHSLSPQRRSQMTTSLIIKLLRALLPKGSLVQLENAHWMDSASWALAGALSQESNLAILVVVSMRPIEGDVPIQYSQMSNSTHATHLRVKNLSEDECSELITTTLEVTGKLSKDVTKNIMERTEGNPFLTVAIVSAMRDSGAIQFNKNKELVFVEGAASIPMELSGLLTSKVDKLHPGQQIILKIGSVIGQVFDMEIVSRILALLQTDSTLIDMSTKPEILRKDMREIEASGLIVRDSPEPDLTYQFANTLVKDVIYSLMLYSLRRDIHKAIVDYYNEKYSGNPTYYPLLAYHSKQAEMKEEAYGHYKKCGSTALSQNSHKEAVSFLTDAKELINDLNMESDFERIEINRKLGQAHYHQGQLKKADETLTHALELMGMTIPDGIKLKNAVKKRSLVTAPLMFHPRKEKEIHNERNHRQREAILCLLSLARIAYYRNDKNRCTYASIMATVLSSQTEFVAMSSDANAFEAVTFGYQGDHNSAESSLGKAIRAAKDSEVIMRFHMTAGMYYSGRGKWNLVKENFKKAREMAVTIGDLKSSEDATLFLDFGYFVTGDMSDSVKRIKKVVESSAHRTDNQNYLLSKIFLARTFYTLGIIKDCMHAIMDVGYAWSKEQSDAGDTDVSATMNYRPLMALLLLKHDKFPEANQHAEKAFQLASSIDPTTYFSLYGYSWLVEYYLTLMRNPVLYEKHANIIVRTKIQTRFKKCLGFLKHFSMMFQIAEPRYRLLKGIGLFLDKKQSQAESQWKRALQLAQDGSMRFEEAVILFHRGTHLASDDDLAAANKILPTISSQALDPIPPERRFAGKKQRKQLSALKMSDGKGGKHRSSNDLLADQDLDRRVGRSRTTRSAKDRQSASPHITRQNSRESTASADDAIPIPKSEQVPRKTKPGLVVSEQSG
eukprot:TRINITY_DN1370_c0_g1_i1.p1 TRINITY_DN1370_c0_g1~~TRINITY_DN1370_c0_g1_i1.p1  ORF type:complete len:1601 (+),score=583.09 TRINITY_DN1370_c0_g1_i1:488-4804(+)